jgi:opacity protein-like surface antigen
MKNVSRRLLAGAAILAATVVSAQAADLGHGSIKDYGGPMVAPQMPVTYSSPSSWYIRGDVSMSNYDNPTMFEHDGTSEYDLVQTKIGRNWALGGGIGRYLGANTRMDITMDWMRKSKVSGFMSPIIDDGVSNPSSPCATAGLSGCAVNLPGTHSFDLQSTVGLLNFYYDFGQRGHFSPYVGVGLGFVRHTTSGGKIDGYFENVGGTANYVNGMIENKTSNQLAGAVMAGFSVALRSNMHLDAGYRFLYMGKAETGAVKGSSSDIAAINDALAAGGGGPIANPAYNDPTLTDLHAHQFRLGVRYDFGGGSSCGSPC